jgi:hypothetical protein
LIEATAPIESVDEPQPIVVVAVKVWVLDKILSAIPVATPVPEFCVRIVQLPIVENVTLTAFPPNTAIPNSLAAVVVPLVPDEDV